MAEEFPLPYSSQDLTGEVAMVTGATSGLGRRFAEVLAAAGAKVAITGRREDRLQEVAEEIRARGGEALPIRVDMTDSANVLESVGVAEEALGTVTILVNNAGIPDAQRAHKMSLDLIDAVIDTNLRGPYILSCEVARRLMAAKKPGRMVNISSIGGFNYGGNGAALYSITKSAIARMTEALAVEWSRFHINVNCIAPGAFESEMMGRDAGAHGRHITTFSAWPHLQPGADGQHVVVPVRAVVRMRHRYDHQDRRRAGHALARPNHGRTRWTTNRF